MCQLVEHADDRKGFPSLAIRGVGSNCRESFPGRVLGFPLHRRADENILVTRFNWTIAKRRKIGEGSIVGDAKTARQLRDESDDAIGVFVPGDGLPGADFGIGNRVSRRRAALVMPMIAKPGVEGVNGTQHGQRIGIAPREFYSRHREHMLSQSASRKLRDGSVWSAQPERTVRTSNSVRRDRT